MKNASAFRFADWEVDPSTNSIARGVERKQMEPRVMDVLLALCQRANTVVSTEELLEQCWGTTLHGDNPVHKTIAQLRSLLGDNTKAPIYIETIRKRGYRTIADVVPGGETASGSWTSKSPFRGLQSFGEDDAPVFFGRADAIGKLLETVSAQARAGRDMTLVLGPSGSGKTSLVRAGLLPALLRGGQADGLTVLSSTSFDLAELGEHALPTALGGVMLDWEVGEAPIFPGASGVSLGQRLLADFDSVRAELQAAVGEQSGEQRRRLVLFIDRFETIFAAPHIGEAEREALLTILDALARSRCVIVILACRNDFYPQVAGYPVLMASKTYGGHFDVAPPTSAEIAQIIRLPAQAAGLSFGVDPLTKARLDDVLCGSAAGSNDALPLLQHTLQELFRTRTPEGELSVEAFRHLGGVEGAIGKRAEEVVGALEQAQRDRLPHVLSLLVTLSDRDEVVTSRRAPWSALSTPADKALVGALVDARLFVSELVGDAPGFGVAHEALLRRWPRVTEWIDEHRHALKVRARLQLLTARWISEGHSADLLLPEGKQLDEAVELAGSAHLSLAPDEAALVAASRKRSRWRARLRLVALSAIVGLSLVSAGLGLSALSAKQLAQERRAEAERLMGFMLGDFADKLRPIGKLDLLDSVSGKALEYLSSSADDELSVASLTQRAKALQVLAEVHFQRGNPPAALEALAAARAILQKQLGNGGDQWEVLKNLGANAFWQGQIHQNQSNWDLAQASYKQYQHYSDMLYQLDPANVEGWVEQSYSHTNLGQLALQRGQAAVAAREFEASIALKQRAAEKRPEDRTLSGDLANSLSWLGNSQEALGELRKAEQIYDREHALLKQLHLSAPGESVWASRAAGALQRRGKLRVVLGRDAEAALDMIEAEQLLQQVMAREPNHRVWQGNLAVIRLDRLRITHLREGGKRTLAPLLALAADARALGAVDPRKSEWIRLNASIDAHLGLIRAELGDLEQAQGQLKRAVQHLDQLYQRNRLDHRVASDLARARVARAAIAAARGQREAMLDDCAAAASLVPALARQSADHRMLDPWVRSQTCLGNTALAAQAKATLARIGYQDPSYLRYMTTITRGINEQR